MKTFLALTALVASIFSISPRSDQTIKQQQEKASSHTI